MLLQTWCGNSSRVLSGAYRAREAEEGACNKNRHQNSHGQIFRQF